MKWPKDLMPDENVPGSGRKPDTEGKASPDKRREWQTHTDRDSGRKPDTEGKASPDKRREWQTRTDRGSGRKPDTEGKTSPDKRREWQAQIDRRLAERRSRARLASLWKSMRRLAIALAALLVLGGVALAYYDAGDWTPWFRELKGQLTSGPVKNEDIREGEGCAFYDVELGSSDGHRVPCRLSIPLVSTGPGTWPAVVLVTGAETGRKMVDLLPPQRKFVLVAPDYPAAGSMNFSGTGPSLISACKLRWSALRMVSDVLLVGDFLLAQKIVRKDHIVLLGVDLGALVSTAAAAADDKGRFSEVLLVQGGGDLGKIITANAERWKLPFGATVAGDIGGWLFKPLEPMRYVARIAPRRLTMYNTKTDSRMPSERAQQLFDGAGEPKKLVWLDGAQSAPGGQTTVLQLTTRVFREITGPGASTMGR